MPALLPCIAFLPFYYLLLVTFSLKHYMQSVVAKALPLLCQFMQSFSYIHHYLVWAYNDTPEQLYLLVRRLCQQQMKLPHFALVS